MEPQAVIYYRQRIVCFGLLNQTKYRDTCVTFTLHFYELLICNGHDIDVKYGYLTL